MPGAGGRHGRRPITGCGWETILDGYTWYAVPPTNIICITSRLGFYRLGW